jgi:hypothetical protein
MVGTSQWWMFVGSPLMGAKQNCSIRVEDLPEVIMGHGTFAIYLQSGNDHGLWQL